MNKGPVNTNILKIVTLLLFMFCGAIVHAQDADAQKQKESDNAPAMGKMQKKVLAKQKAEQKEAEKERQAALKQHMKNQTPEVRKRMKEHAKEANRNNEHKEPGFFYKLFHHQRTPKSSVKPGTQAQ